MIYVYMASKHQWTVVSANVIHATLAKAATACVLDEGRVIIMGCVTVIL